MKFILFFLFIMAASHSHAQSYISVERPNKPDTLCLGARSGYFSFGLASLPEFPASGVVYKWTLKGYDKEWHTSEKENKIHYAGLDPGNYLLMLHVFSSSYRKVLQKELLVIVYPRTNKGVLFLYVFLLLLSIASVWVHAVILRKKTSRVSVLGREDTGNKKAGYAPADREFLEKVDKIVETHCCDRNFTLSELYKEIGMSRSSFNNKWKILGRESARLCILQARLEKAKTLLSTTSQPVTDVADKCGFCDVKYFREVFKTEVGVTPSEYRKVNRASFYKAE